MSAGTRATKITTAAAALITVSASAQVGTTVVVDVVWERSQGGNGHRYLGVVVDSPLAWTGARVLAETEFGGHLATLTSEAENNFVFENIRDRSTGLWTTFDFGTPTDPNPVSFGPWLGGFQAIGSAPLDGWSW